MEQNDQWDEADEGSPDLEPPRAVPHKKKGGWLTERNAVLAIAGLFLVMTVLIAIVPYDPSNDLADATTNNIWVDYYSQGIFGIPYSDWTYGSTQSSVVLHDGVYTVVNEKGPGLAFMLIPFRMTGTEVLFGPLMVGLAVLSTYMLGKRLFNWKIGAISSVLVLTDVSVVMMWYRYIWTDAATMHLLVLSIWLMVESMFWLNGRSLDPKAWQRPSVRQRNIGMAFAILSGLSFAASVSTRYVTALVLIPMLLALAAFYLVRCWPAIKDMDLKGTLHRSAQGWAFLALFAIGLMVILIPLMAYNVEYFGGPFRSGYDATTLSQFVNGGALTSRSFSDSWFASLSDSVSTVWGNLTADLGTLISRMPFLLMFPLGAWLARKNVIGVVLLPAWVFVNFYSYLSLGWMDQYSGNFAGMLFEPRYFMPAVPAIALLAGLAIYRIGSWTKELFWNPSHETMRRNAIVVAITITAMLVISSIIPAANFLSGSNAGSVGPGQPNNNPNQGVGPRPRADTNTTAVADIQMDTGLINNSNYI